jgi:nitrite reductase/ring-hydroxylating ferredoxin subunit
MIGRLWFMARFRTLGKIAARGGRLHACGRHGVHPVPTRCPHQGAPLVNAIVQGDEVVCPWHGCRFQLQKGTWTRARALRP